MANMNEYLDQNQTALTENNYNELDALVFSQLSYMKFEKLYKGGTYEGMEISVQDYAITLQNNASKMGLSGEQLEFINMLAKSERYENCMISNMRAENENSQWAALTISMGDNSDADVIAMRGTDGTSLGWSEDFQLLYDADGTEAQHLSQEYLQNSQSERIYLAGHSKGGNDVSSAYCMVSEDVRDRVERIDNFDGPGVNIAFRSQEEYADGYTELSDKLHNYYPQDTTIGKLLIDNPGMNHYVYSDISGIREKEGILGQHDPFCFQIEYENSNYGFERTQQTALSEFLNQTLDQTVSQLSFEERKKLYAFAEKLGLYNMIAKEENPFSDNEEVVQEAVKHFFEQKDPKGFIPDNRKEGLSNRILVVYSIMEGISIYQNMTPEEQEAAKKALGLFVVNGVQYIIGETKEYVQEKWDQFVSFAQQKFDNAYLGIFGVIGKVSVGIADTIFDIYSGVKTTIEDIKSDFTDFIVGVINCVTGRTTFENASIRVSIPVMENTINTMEKVSGHIREIKEDVSRIRRELNLITNAMNFLTFTSIDWALCAEANKCDTLKNGLEQICEYYVRTENAVMEAAR